MSLPSLARLVRLISLVSCTIAVAVSVSGSSPAADGERTAVVTAAEAAPGAWQWPIEGTPRIIRAYAAPPTPYAAGHRGIDIAASAGDDVVAPTGGIVHFSGFVVDRAVISLQHPGGLISSMEPVESTLAAGERVARGEVIGTVADASAHCAGPCIHLGVRRHGEYISPLNYLGGIERSVLLPTRHLG